MPQSRKHAWLRDELLVALDLYRREGRNPTKAGAAEVSQLLRGMPIERELAENETFRNPASVHLKVANFVAIDPADPTSGMSRGGRGDREVWEEFAADSARLAAVVAAIRAHVHTPEQPRPVDDDIADAPEGRLLTRAHLVRERNSRLVSDKKAQAAAAPPGLACEGCGFDFGAVYGERGDGFAECHHTVPLSKLAPGSRTKLTDLALVCSNCHRIIHRRAPWLTMDQLRTIVDEYRVP